MKRLTELLIYGLASILLIAHRGQYSQVLKQVNLELNRFQ